MLDVEELQRELQKLDQKQEPIFLKKSVGGPSFININSRKKFLKSLVVLVVTVLMKRVI